MRLFAIAGFCFSLMCIPAMAGPAAEVLAAYVYDGTLTAGINALDPLVQKGDAEAKAERGALKFRIATEHLSQAFYKHRFETASGGPMMNLPVMRISVPPNPNPEKLDYPGFRSILATLVGDLDAAEADLAQVGDADVKLPLDIGKLRLDLNGDSHLATWNRMMDVFQGNFLGYAFYFN